MRNACDFMPDLTKWAEYLKAHITVGQQSKYHCKYLILILRRGQSVFWPFLNHSISVKTFCWSELAVMNVRMLHVCPVLFKQHTIQLWHHECEQSEESVYGDNKPPLSYSLRNNPSIQSVPSSSLLLLSRGREEGPVPDLYLVCCSSMGLCGCYHPLPPAKTPAAHSGSVA